MNNLFNPILETRFNSLVYRFRFLALYILFGVISLLIEFFIRTYLISKSFDTLISTLLAIFVGILFAFYANVLFNFKIQKSRRNKALVYFILISCTSSLIQWSFRKLFIFESISYEYGRFLISGFLFSLGYLMHKKYSFRDYKKVGVAIYATGVENLKEIYDKIGHFPDFIHVDIIDKTMKDDAEEVETYRLETMRAYWPGIQIQTHIMSAEPTKWLSKVMPYSDVIYIHAECNENVESLLKEIKTSGKKAGIALKMETKPKDVLDILQIADYVLLLTIPKPGSSGQKFDIDGINKIKEINNLPFRNQFLLCIDGGVNENIIDVLQAENIVSGSAVLGNINPKRQIMRLQTTGRYESV